MSIDERSNVPPGANWRSYEGAAEGTAVAVIVQPIELRGPAAQA